RYSYCLNNPLLYIDEDGEMPLLLAGALLGGCVNLVYKACSGQIHSAGDAFAAFGIGAVAGLAGTVTGGWAFGAAGGGFLAGAAAGGIGTATDMYLQSLGNHAYFGEPIISTKDLLVGAAFGAITAGAINGSVAAYEGKNYWTGEMIAEGKGTFSFNNPRINGLQKNLSIEEMAEILKPGLKPKKYNQEFVSSIENGTQKISVRVESHGKVDLEFPELNLTPQDIIRHFNIQYYERGSNGEWIKILLPNQTKPNVHKFLNKVKK
ncbi:MAG: hypothetical protein K1W37_10870, partial [Lachnospiraceae bacterium]